MTKLTPEIKALVTSAGFKVFDDRIVAGDNNVSGRATVSVLKLIELVEAQTRKQCASEAAMFSIDRNSTHPDLTWDQLNETAQFHIHNTAQAIAYHIANSGKPEENDDA